MDALQDPDTTVRCAAADVLRNSPTPTAIHLLQDQLKFDQALRFAARNALVAIGQTALPAAIDLLHDADADRRVDGSYILGQLRNSDSLSDHLALLSDSNWSVVAQAADSLGRIGQGHAGNALLGVVKKLPQMLADNDKAQAELEIHAVANAIVAAGLVGYSPIVKATLPLIPQGQAPDEIRRASIYAYGLLGDRTDDQTSEELLGIIYDQYEAPDVKAEAIKALGNLRVESRLAELKAISESELNLQLRWLANWAYDRIAGQQTPLQIPTISSAQQVCIADAPGMADQQTIAGMLSLGPSYLPDCWTPLRLKFQNGSGKDVAGYASVEMNNAAGPALLHVPCLIPAHCVIDLDELAYFGSGAGGAPNQACVVEWYAGNAQRIGRSEVPGAAAAIGGKRIRPTAMLLQIGHSEIADSAGDNPAGFAGQLLKHSGFALGVQSIDAADAPRRADGYDGYKFILFSTNPQELDMAQRRALLDYLSVGGTLLLCGHPIEQSCWLAGYLPVVQIGSRQISALATENDEIQLSHPVSLVEASDVTGADVEVAGQSQGLIFAAQKQIGLGHVIFTSFPIYALDPADPHFVQTWHRILQWDVSPRAESVSLTRPLEHMVGVPTVPFSIAAVIVGLYIVVAFLGHLLSPARLRPRVYLCLVAVALLGFVGLMVASARGESSSIVRGGQITTIRIGSGGGGIEKQLLTFVGRDESSLTLSATGGATIVPVESSESMPAEIEEFPFAVKDADVYAKQVRRIWSAQRPVGSDLQLKATGRFGPEGLELSVENGAGQALHSPLLAWSGVFALGEIPVGQSTPIILHRNADNDFTSTGAIRTQTDDLRADIIASSVMSAGSMDSAESGPPKLLAWLDNPPTIVDTNYPIAMESQTLLEAPVLIQSSEIGSDIFIDGAFSRIIQGAARGLPYDPSQRRWVPTNQPGQWLIGFAVPEKIGRLRPVHVQIDADLSAPTQTIAFFRDQCRAGIAAINPQGDEAANWTRVITPQSFEFDCRSDDYDSEGHVWLMLRIEATSASPSPWFFRRLEMSYHAICTEARGNLQITKLAMMHRSLTWQ